jgi:hypothetical protein
MASFDYYLREAGLTTFGSGAPIQSVEELRTTYWSGADGYLSDNESEGWEFETIANPTRNWTVRFGYAYTDRSRTNLLLEGEPWWAERLALWENLNAIYAGSTGQSVYDQLLFNQNDAFSTISVAQRIADSDRLLAETRLQQEQGFGNRKHKTNLWARYSFTEGWAKGLAVAGGWRFQSKNVAGIDLDTGEVLFGNPRSLFDLMLQYKTRGLLGFVSDKVSTTYQLNVYNLFNDRTFFITKTRADPRSGARYMFRGFREDPRSMMFTMRLAF